MQPCRLRRVRGGVTVAVNVRGQTDGAISRNQANRKLILQNHGAFYLSAGVNSLQWHNSERVDFLIFLFPLKYQAKTKVYYIIVVPKCVKMSTPLSGKPVFYIYLSAYTGIPHMLIISHDFAVPVIESYLN